MKARSELICDPAGLGSITPDCVASLFDTVPHVVFFVKDHLGQYTQANTALLKHLKIRCLSDIVGSRSSDIVPAPFGKYYEEEDELPLSGIPINNKLGIHSFSGDATFWCLTCKVPVYLDDNVIGLTGISRDLAEVGHPSSTFARFKRIYDYMNDHFYDPLKIGSLAEVGELSISQLERMCANVFQLTPIELLSKIRIDNAMMLLRGTAPLSSVAQSCGYTDQSAFCRQFRVVTGLTPGQYRSRISVNGNARPNVTS